MKMNMCFTKNLLRTFKRIYLERPLLGDCLTYAVLYPMGSFLHQNIDDKNCKHYDYATMMRFSIFGAFYVAPLLHGWIKLTSAMWPHTNFKSGLAKTLVEQVSLSPISSYTFFLGMALLEGKTFQNARKEANEKFLPTFKVSSNVRSIDILSKFYFRNIYNKQKITTLDSFLRLAPVTTFQLFSAA
uniref:Uncharacterized protein n=1 Tax=Glossina pallidipes TaxID=7398 RepID=A0A1B0A0A1_GLOPL